MKKSLHSEDDGKSAVIRIPPFHYIHILDTNNNITVTYKGPLTHVRQENERLVKGPEKMAALTVFDFCKVKNPVEKDENGAIVIENGQAKIQYGEEEYRLHQPPFALYPGEILEILPSKLRVLEPNSALTLQALINFVDDKNIERNAGDEWLFEGPGTYYPRKEVKILNETVALQVEKGKAIRLRAKRDCVDRNGNKRFYGEEWLVRKLGSYLPGPYEEFVKNVDAITLTDRQAVQLRAIRTHVDIYGKNRRQGEAWLITNKEAQFHIPDVDEELISLTKSYNLNSRQYAVKLNPVDENGVCQLGKRQLVTGECSFFLHPDESLAANVEDVYVLSEKEGLVLTANESVTIDGKVRVPGEKWMIRGPCEYIPPVEVDVLRRRTAIALDVNEGIYVRDTKTGRVRAVIGTTYMLNQDEELWEKKLPPMVEQLLLASYSSNPDSSTLEANQGKKTMSRFSQMNQQEINNKSNWSTETLDKTCVISLQVPHNSAVQIYDYEKKMARVQFGPDRVMLGPDEQFTVLSLSGGKPKRVNQIKALCMFLGPDFCTDIITVETADHARLSLQLSYNWMFDMTMIRNAKTSAIDPVQAARLFSMPDFIGDMCKSIASRVRGTVAGVSFDDFHKNSSDIIQRAVFGCDAEGNVRDSLKYEANCLVVTNIDVQSVEPVDQRTRESLQKSVQLAIEITTNSQEAAARHEAERLEQEARGKLERQRIEDEAAAEAARKRLLELQVQSAAVESTGQAKAEATSRSEAMNIEGKASVDQARLKAEASRIEAENQLEMLKKARDEELRYNEAKNAIVISKLKAEALLESKRFTSMVQAIGADTLNAIAVAGPDQEVRMLKALGLQSTLITDGSSPINLMNTAHGLVGQAMSGVRDVHKGCSSKAGDKRKNELKHGEKMTAAHGGSRRRVGDNASEDESSI